MGGSLGLAPGRWRQCRWRCRGSRVAWEGVRQRRPRRASSRTCLWGLVLSTGRRKRWPRTVPTRAEYVWSPSTGQSCRAMCACSWLGNTVSGCSWTRAQPEPVATTRKWLRVLLTPSMMSFRDGDCTGTTRWTPSMCSSFRILEHIFR